MAGEPLLEIAHQIFLWVIYAFFGLMIGGILFVYIYQKTQQNPRFHRVLVDSVLFLPHIVFLSVFLYLMNFVFGQLLYSLYPPRFIFDALPSAVAILGLGFIFAANLTQKISENEGSRSSGFQSRVLRLIGFGSVNRTLVARYDLEVLEATLEVLKALAVVHLIGAQNITMVLLQPYYWLDQFGFGSTIAFEYQFVFVLALAALYAMPIYIISKQVRLLRTERMDATIAAAATLPLQKTLPRTGRGGL